VIETSKEQRKQLGHSNNTADRELEMVAVSRTLRQRIGQATHERQSKRGRKLYSPRI